MAAPRIVTAIMLAALGACSDDDVAELRAVKDEVCACKTAACAETALKKVPAPKGPSTARAQELARQLQDCLIKAYDRERPTQDPDAESVDDAGVAP